METPPMPPEANQSMPNEEQMIQEFNRKKRIRTIKFKSLNEGFRRS